MQDDRRRCILNRYGEEPRQGWIIGPPFQAGSNGSMAVVFVYEDEETGQVSTAFPEQIIFIHT